MNLATRISTAMLVAVTFVATTAFADDDDSDWRRTTYEVTITNITKGQVFSPPVLVTHKRSVALFAVGKLRWSALVAGRSTTCASYSRTGGRVEAGRGIDRAASAGGVPAPGRGTS